MVVIPWCLEEKLFKRRGKVLKAIFKYIEASAILSDYILLSVTKYLRSFNNNLVISPKAVFRMKREHQSKKLE
jgi:hypothetical protein